MGDLALALSIDHVAFVLNPRSGGGGAGRTYLTIAEHLRRYEVQIAVFETSRRAGAGVAAEAALQAGFTEVWVIGGDGTIQEAIAPIMEADAVLGPLPGGTSNRLVEVVGHTASDPVQQALWMMRQRARRMDVGECNGRPFTVRMGVGFEAVAAQEVEDDKSGLGSLAYVFAGLRAVRQIVPRHVRLTAADETVYEGPMLAAMITNVPFRVGLKVPGFASADPVDGDLHAIILRERPGIEALWRWLTGMEERPAGDEVFTHCAPAYHLSLDSGAQVHLDGEAAGALDEIDLRCVPQGLRVRGLKLAPGTAAAPEAF